MSFDQWWIDNQDEFEARTANMTVSAALRYIAARAWYAGIEDHRPDVIDIPERVRLIEQRLDVELAKRKT